MRCLADLASRHCSLLGRPSFFGRFLHASRINHFVTPPSVWLRKFDTFRPLRLIELPPETFNARIRQDLIHSEVKRHLSTIRAGTAYTKSRGDVRGSGRKIHPQKGTGKARAGSSRAPHRKGGTDVRLSVSRRAMLWTQAAGLFPLPSAQGKLALFEESALSSDFLKTAAMARILDRISKRRITIMHTDGLPSNIKLASNALAKRVSFINVQSNALHAYDALNASFLFISSESIPYIVQQQAQ